MKKLVELDAAVSALDDLPMDYGRWDVDDVLHALASVPTVDAVPVVRCKDCMHYGFTDNRIPEEQAWWCYFWDDVRSPDAYCSDGEREGGDEHEVG